MSYPHFYQKGALRYIRLNAAKATVSPPYGKRWMLIGATVSHITATSSELILETIPGQNVGYATIAAATGTGVYSAFKESAAEAARPWLFNNEFQIRVTGGAGFFYELIILEVKEWYGAD